jgi:hypothetical protein
MALAQQSVHGDSAGWFLQLATNLLQEFQWDS